MSRMNTQVLPRLKIAGNQFSGKFEPGRPLSAERRQEESVAAEDSRAQGLLKADANLYLWRSTEKTVAMDHVFVSGRDFHRHNVSWQLCREGEFSGGARGAGF